MMEQQFFEDEFEQFLRETADQHRMYPSDGVWTNIYRHFHSGRRKIALGAMLLLVLSGIVWLASTNSVDKSGKSRPGITIRVAEPGQAASSRSTVTVNDIIEKLRAKSLIPPMTIAAPLSLSPLQLKKSNQFSDIYKSFEFHQDLNNAIPSPEISKVIVNTETILENQSLIARIAPATSIVPANSPAIQAPGKEKPLNTLETSSVTSAESAKITVSPFNSKTKNKVSFLMSFAPSIGYRNLFQGKNHITYGNSPLMVRHLNVNQFVDHQPSIGFELGAGVRYQATRVLAFRTGLQFNLTRYSIAAFSHSPEKATLSLNPANGYRRETLVATSNVRNILGNDPERLQNQYLQIALPIAAELRLFGDSKLQLSIAGSIQPVYLLNTNQYLLSNDFSNYVKEPSLIRRWNMATGMEAFIAYSNGKIRWQVGPQFRYNLLSTFKKQYAIRENLMEYGVKFGVSKTIR